MPLKKGLVMYSKVVTLPSGYKTLGLFDKNYKLIECRVCAQKPNGRFKCIRGATHPNERKKLAHKIGLNPKTGMPLKKYIHI